MLNLCVREAHEFFPLQRIYFFTPLSNLAAPALLDISYCHMGRILGTDGSSAFIWQAFDQYGYVGACVYFVWLPTCIFCNSSFVTQGKSLAVLSNCTQLGCYWYLYRHGVQRLRINSIAGSNGFNEHSAERAIGFLLFVYDHFCSQPNDYKIL